MIDKLIFDELDPSICEYRRDWRGRFSSGGGGSVGYSRGSVRGVGVKKKGSYTVTGGKGAKKAYVYRVGKGGKMLRAPKAGMARHASRSLVLRRTRPGAKMNRTGSIRYISRGHERTRMITPPGSISRQRGRYHSESVIKRAATGQPMKPGYVVAYGKPLPGT